MILQTIIPSMSAKLKRPGEKNSEKDYPLVRGNNGKYTTRMTLIYILMAIYLYLSFSITIHLKYLFPKKVIQEIHSAWPMRGKNG